MWVIVVKAKNQKLLFRVNFRKSALIFRKFFYTKERFSTSA